jgi:hypothetical protein
MSRQSSALSWGSSLRSLAGAVAVIVLAASVGPAAFAVIWLCNASLYH